MFNLKGGGGNLFVVMSLTMKVYNPVRNVAMLECVNLVFTQGGVETIIRNFGEWSLASSDACTRVAIMPLGFQLLLCLV